MPWVVHPTVLVDRLPDAPAAEWVIRSRVLCLHLVPLEDGDVYGSGESGQIKRLAEWCEGRVFPDVAGREWR